MELHLVLNWKHLTMAFVAVQILREMASQASKKSSVTEPIDIPGQGVI